MYEENKKTSDDILPNNLAGSLSDIINSKSYARKTKDGILEIKTENYKSRLYTDKDSPKILHHSFNSINEKSKVTPYKDMVDFFHSMASENKIIQTKISPENSDLIIDAMDIGFSYCGITKSIDANGIFKDVALFFLTKDTLIDIPKRKLTLFPQAGISDGVLTLRATSAEDCNILYHDQCDLTTRYWSIYPESSFHTIAKEANLAVLRWIAGEKMNISIIENGSKELVGRMSLRPVIPPKVADVGYGIFKNFRGKGYSSRALKLFTHWAFSTAGYMRIELGVKVGNTASERTAINAGYHFEGLCRGRLINNDGSFSDQLSYVKLNPTIVIKAIGIKD
ncbi:GNAT family N-acetyltransferase [Serratia sp. MYb239]|uniref:GNAT family N-acetyltransferase n=1 Tax=Serratia sp. MYb239 TaxID=2033438 RepID=UPI001319F4FC|nr:GNAT family protein [Serratia sp. MYb239]